MELLPGQQAGRRGWLCGWTRVQVNGQGGGLRESGSAVLLACLPARCLLFPFNCHTLKDFPPEGSPPGPGQAYSFTSPAWALGVSAVHATVQEVELAGMSLGRCFPRVLSRPRGPPTPDGGCQPLPARNHLTDDSLAPSLGPSCSLSIRTKALPSVRCPLSVDDSHSTPLPHQARPEGRMLGPLGKPEPGRAQG